MTHNSERELIGASPKFLAALADVEVAAPADCTVLLHGETGTGKELFARAIHEKSSRRRGPFITVNCAAIPAGLLESELFGHERGAYTGALVQTVGRFQLADHGTIFLDEIGDLPLELQPKLLRVLQEREFEKLGSSRTVRVDVRVIAATHQSLAQMVTERRYRADLYYRLDVFPITLPPLRERRDDIPCLIRHFVSHFAVRARKRIDHIPEEFIGALQCHDWPGNIRELQNVLERAVLLSTDAILSMPRTELTRKFPQTPECIRTLAEVERRSITEALKRTNWVIGGPGGAAAQLGLPRTTLISRMKKHGISRETMPFPANGSAFSDIVLRESPSNHGAARSLSAMA
jgi:formate hydrogenlyase transcriptional activator